MFSVSIVSYYNDMSRTFFGSGPWSFPQVSLLTSGVFLWKSAGVPWILAAPGRWLRACYYYGGSDGGSVAVFVLAFLAGVCFNGSVE